MSLDREECEMLLVVLFDGGGNGGRSDVEGR
jgi:hypothetical protein